MSPSPTPLHQYVGLMLDSEIRDQLSRNKDCKCLVVPEINWRINRTTVVRPDILILFQGLPPKYLNYVPSIIAEVLSPATSHKDRTAKRELYQQQGVGWYFLVDVEQKTTEALELIDGIYVERSTVNGHIACRVDERCEVSLKLDRIFPQ
jgi:Uma2 family endonuclease